MILFHLIPQSDKKIWEYVCWSFASAGAPHKSSQEENSWHSGHLMSIY